MKEMPKFWNEVFQVEQKHDKHKANTKADLHKSNKRHKPDKCQPLFKGLKYERYTPLMPNHTMILEEACNLDETS